MAKCDDILFRPPPGRRVKVVRKINPCHLPLLQAGGGNTITPIVLCTGGGQQAFCIYIIIITINFPVEQTSSNGLSLSSFLRVRLF